MTSELKGKTIAFIGGGAMAKALAGGLIASGIPTSCVLVSEPDAPRRTALERELGIQTTSDNAEAVKRAQIVVLAVKPQILPVVLDGLSKIPDKALAQPLWISIAAGIPLATLAGRLPERARIVRAMPNTPAQVHAGATAWVANGAATQKDRRAADALFRAVGTSWEAPQEALLDAVTGLSGSGPAYLFVIIEALSDAGVRVGLPRDAATQLAAQTVFGAAKLVLESGAHPGVLKDQVTSPGGTTIAGLERLEAGGLRAAIHDAVAAATQRAREIGGTADRKKS